MTQLNYFIKIDKQLFIKLFLAFIAATIVGTVSHELGHYFVAKYFGYSTTINYATTFWEPTNQDEVVTAARYFYITLGGPAQTLLTGTIGVLLLFYFRKHYYTAQQLNWRQWTIIFLSLFWLRQTANLVTWLAGFVMTGQYSTRGDEIKLAHHLQLPVWSIMTVTAALGLIVLSLIVFQFVPHKQRVTFLAAGLAGGIAGYILWLEMFGQYIMP
jgi:hypothetical protein